MYYLIYKITNKLNNKIYIGAHKTKNKNDNYFGSGIILKRSVEKHGKENFNKEILFECSTENEMWEKEAGIVDEEFVARDDTYNIKLGGCGGFDYINENKLQNTEKTVPIRQKHAESMRNKFLAMYNEDENFRNEWKEKVKSGIKFHQLLFGNNTFGGKSHSDETKKKMSQAKKGKYDGNKNPAYGKHWITDGSISKLVSKAITIPKGFRKGRV